MTFSESGTDWFMELDLCRKYDLSGKKDHYLYFGHFFYALTLQRKRL